ncbi:heat shock factor 2-binding protein isoform X2 [Sardina pilchardus]|uniref:heat shock factor 2-binding protein isoform X2 n=1 Tax=Sardina pilchardus TaxID=27697 RepID=UPI002E132199
MTMKTSETKIPTVSPRTEYLQDCGRDGYVSIRKRDMEKLTTEVMQLREFLPKVINGDLLDSLHKARQIETQRERLEQEQEKQRQDCLHLRSRLELAQTECQREREEKLALREQLWQCREQLQQQAEFCTGLGAAVCTLLWSASSKEEAVRDILADGKLEPFLSVAGQTLESFVKSLDQDSKLPQQDSNSHEHQFVLALAGVVTNLGAVTCGRDFLSNSAHVLLDTLMELLGLIKPGVFSKLKVERLGRVPPRPAAAPVSAPGGGGAGPRGLRPAALPPAGPHPPAGLQPPPGPPPDGPGDAGGPGASRPLLLLLLPGAPEGPREGQDSLPGEEKTASSKVLVASGNTVWLQPKQTELKRFF